MNHQYPDPTPVRSAPSIVHARRPHSPDRRIDRDAPIAEIRRAVEAMYDFLAQPLKPHAGAEDAALDPVVQQVPGSPNATKTMSRDPVEVGLSIAELAVLKDALTSA